MMMMMMMWTLLLASLINAGLNDTAACNSTANSKKVGLMTTSQSSNYTDQIIFCSKRAIDGDKETCAHTLQQERSWWKADLFGVYNISCISIYNEDKKYTNLSGAQIYIGNSRERNGINNHMYKNITRFKINEHNYFHADEEVLGRYVTVFMPAYRHLIICDMVIWANLQESPFHLVTMNMTWQDALYYCRDNYKDLASIRHERDQAWAELEAIKAQSAHVWLGLHYTCTLEFWFWVDDSELDYDRWTSNEKEEECDMSVAMDTKEDHRWFKMPDLSTFNFICRKND